MDTTPRRRAVAAEAVELAESELRAWEEAAPAGRRHFTVRSLRTYSGHVAWSAVEDTAVIATGYSARGFEAAMLSCAAELRRVLALAERRDTIPAPALEAAE